MEFRNNEGIRVMTTRPWYQQWGEAVYSVFDRSYIPSVYRDTVYVDNARDEGHGAPTPQMRSQAELQQLSADARAYNGGFQQAAHVTQVVQTETMNAPETFITCGAAYLYGHGTQRAANAVLRAHGHAPLPGVRDLLVPELRIPTSVPLLGGANIGGDSHYSLYNPNGGYHFTHPQHHPTDNRPISPLEVFAPEPMTEIVTAVAPFARVTGAGRAAARAAPLRTLVGNVRGTIFWRGVDHVVLNATGGADGNGHSPNGANDPANGTHSPDGAPGHNGQTSGGQTNGTGTSGHSGQSSGGSWLGNWLGMGTLIGAGVGALGFIGGPLGIATTIAGAVFGQQILTSLGVLAQPQQIYSAPPVTPPRPQTGNQNPPAPVQNETVTVPTTIPLGTNGVHNQGNGLN